jgi:hypothetical protein
VWRQPLAGGAAQRGGELLLLAAQRGHAGEVAAAERGVHLVGLRDRGGEQLLFSSQATEERLDSG